MWLLDKQNISIFPEVAEFFKDNLIWKKACFAPDNHSIIQNLARIDNFWDKLQSSTLDVESDIEKVLEQKADNEYTYEPHIYNNYTDEGLKKAEEMRYQNELKAWKLRVSDLKQKIRLEYIEKWGGLREEHRLGQAQKLERDVSMSSEVPILGYNSFIIGYWDMVVNFQVPHYETNNFLFWHGKQQDVDTIYQSVRTRNRHEYEDNRVFLIEPIFIEVKPVIRSFGETLRQLKTYQSFVPHAVGRTYLFTTDTKFKAAFETQGIKVIEYKPDAHSNNI